MIQVALLNSHIYQKLVFKAKDFPELKIVCAGETLPEVEQCLQEKKANVFIFALEKLGTMPVLKLKSLLSLYNPDFVIISYKFAQKSILAELRALNIKLLQEPVSFPLLKVFMIEQSVNNLFGKNSRKDPEVAPIESDNKRRYSSEQLAILQEVTSSVKCECPNHLATLTDSLYSFEDYAQACQEENPEDAEIHAMLHQETTKARLILERALDRLCEHEKIRLEDLKTDSGDLS